MDSAFPTAAFAGCTSAQLQAAIVAGRGTPAMIAEVDRRARRDAGDVTVMTPGERLRYNRAAGGA